VFW
jgi:hypothetical protein